MMNYGNKVVPTFQVSFETFLQTKTPAFYFQDNVKKKERKEEEDMKMM